jgi:predicted RNase H-like HicB family nuclease
MVCYMNPVAETNLSKELVSAKSRVYRFSVVIEKDKDGYFAFSPELQGCYTQGVTYEEAIENIRDAIRLHVEDRLDSGKEVPLAASEELLEGKRSSSGESKVGCY